MKILYVTTVTSTINAFLVPHIEQLVQEGHQVDVASAENQPLNPQLDQLGCQFYPIDFTRSALSLQHTRSYRQIRRLIKERGYDVVHTHTPIASFIVRAASRDLAVKVVYTAHGFHFHQAASRKNRMLYYSMERLAARWTDLLITINDEDYRNSQRLPVRGHVGFTHGIGFRPGVNQLAEDFDRETWRECYGYHERDTVLVYAAELSARKNQSRLIAVLPQLRESVKLLLLGDGPQRQDDELLAHQLGVSNRVTFAGYQTDITPFLAMADIAVSSSRQEGLPVNIMEALAFNLPVVATDIRGHQDLIKSGVNGFLYQTDDQLVTQIHLLLNQPAPFDPQAVQQLLANFSLERVQQELQQLYLQVGIAGNR